MIWVSVKAFLTKKFEGKSVSVNNWIPAQVPFFNLVQAWATTGADLYDRSFWKKSCFSSNKNLLLWRSNFFLFQNFLSVTQIFKKRQKSCRWAEGGEGGEPGFEARKGPRGRVGRGGGQRAGGFFFAEGQYSRNLGESNVSVLKKRKFIFSCSGEQKFRSKFCFLVEIFESEKWTGFDVGLIFPRPVLGKADF